MQYVLPLMLTLMAARWVGNVFNEGLYDVQIHLSKLPFLDDEVPQLGVKNDMTASQAMSRRVRCLRPVERAGTVYDVLSACEHGCFPVVDDREGDILVGTILSRRSLTVLLQEKAFGPPHTNPALGSRVSPLLSWGDMEKIYPRYPTIASVTLTDEERKCWVD
ncbi:unnamed protein product, partial [Discosporangium mesarthrocarpum]